VRNDRSGGEKTTRKHPLGFPWHPQPGGGIKREHTIIHKEEKKYRGETQLEARNRVISMSLLFCKRAVYLVRAGTLSGKGAAGF